MQAIPTALRAYAHHHGWSVVPVHVDLQGEGVVGTQPCRGPRQTLDYSYEKQLDLLQKVRRGVADVATSRKRLEMQLASLAQQADRFEQQGRDALAQGREDLAREALTRRSGIQQQVADLQVQLAQLQADEEKLVAAQQRLAARSRRSAPARRR